MYKNPPAWKTEMRVSGDIFIPESSERRVFVQGIEQAKKQAAEEIWLSYFNEQAYAAGLIDEKTRNRIRVALVRAKAKKQGT